MAKEAADPPFGRIRQEMETNHQALVRLAESTSRHAGKYALMRSGMIVDFFPSTRSAMLAGHERFLDRIFSIHRVRKRYAPAAPNMVNTGRDPA